MDYEKQLQLGILIMDNLDSILAVAHSTYWRRNNEYKYSGCDETEQYHYEYTNEVFDRLVDFDRCIQFLKSQKFNSITNCKTIFNGTYVKIKHNSVEDIYYVCCAPLSKLKGCYSQACREGKILR